MTDTQIDILKAAIDWARAEMLSSAFFALFGVLFLLASFCFWQVGKTDTTKAFVIPLVVAGTLLVILGVGLVISTQIRLTGFSPAFNADTAAFITSEVQRADRTMSGYETAVFRVMPIIVIIAAGLLLVLQSPLWQASMIVVIGMMAVIMVIDTNANARLGDYKAKLLQTEQRP